MRRGLGKNLARARKLARYAAHAVRVMAGRFGSCILLRSKLTKAEAQPERLCSTQEVLTTRASTGLYTGGAKPQTIQESYSKNAGIGMTVMSHSLCICTQV